LLINNPFGLRYFSSDSAAGNTRISLHSETFFFTPYKVLGFRFAPFLYGDISMLSRPVPNKYYGTYYGLGGGIRTRNENFVFGTIELRCIYLPKQIQGMESFRISISSNLQFRYNSNYVKAPEIIQLNSDPQGSIF